MRSSATVAAGSAQPTARSSYANATKPTIVSSAAPPVAVGGPQNAQHGKTSSVSPVNGNGAIKPAIPAMPTIVSGGPNGNGSLHEHSRKSSVQIKQTPPVATSGGPPSGIKFGSLAGSPAPAHASPVVQGNLNPQAQNPRVASPAHSPSPIPTPVSGGPKPDGLPTRPNLVFGGQGGESAEPNTRPAMPSQPNSHALPQAQHLRRESSQSAHSDMSNANMGRGYPPNRGGRGGYPQGHYNPQMANQSPQPYRPLPHGMGRGHAPPFQPPGPMQQRSPYTQNRSPAMTPATMHHQQQLANPQGMPYYPGQQYPQQNMYGMPQPALDPYNNFYQQGYGLQQSIHYPGVPASPGRGYPPQMQQTPYGVAPYGHQPQAQSMSRTPSNMSERPASAVPQPSTPAMTNVNHISHTHTPSITAASPVPNSSFERPKPKSKAIVIKNPDGEVVDFGKKGASPAPPAVVSAPPAAPRSPAIAATPTPPLRAPSASDATRAEDTAAKKADFVKQFQEKLRLQEEAEKKAKEATEEEAKAEANAKLAAKEEADAKAALEAKEKEDAEAAKKAEADAAEKKRLEDEEMERMIAEMEEEERKREADEARYAEEKKKKAEAEKTSAADKVKQEEERLRKLEREAEEAEAARAAETPEQKAEREAKNKALFAGLKKNTMFGPGASQTETSEEPTPAEPTVTAPPPSKTPTGGSKPKPAALKLKTHESVEPAQPTAGMQALKTARFLEVRAEVMYPQGVASPNPALNNSNRSKGRQYDKDFLLQFQDVFKEKPSVDWDMKLKETVGDEPASARGGPPSARPGSMMGGRQPSRSGPGAGNVMGQFQGGGFSGGRTLPAGTTSEQRFQQSQSGRGGSMTNPLAHVVLGGSRGGAFPMAPPMARTSSYQSMPHGGPNSPRVGSSRGKGGGSRRGGNNNAQDAKQMPLTAGQDVKALSRSQTGWVPTSLTQPAAVQAQMSAGHMAPDLVQRKVKAALNKMTPEKFDKISDQILEIAAQSKDETDGRTLRQVIQLTFEKACDESHWSSMYAKFCSRMLQTMSTEIKDENVRDKHGAPVVGGALFRKYLLNRCQEEFERGWEVNLPDAPEDGKEAKLLSDEYYIAAAAKRKGLGLIQFIGELYKLGMLTLRIMHECVLKLLDFEGLPDEAAIESLVKLLRTVGQTMEGAEAGPKMINMYFERIEKVMNMDGLPSRMRFMLLDTVDMRKSGWKSKDILKGPKTIAEIHQEALQAQQNAEMERTRSNQRGGGGGRLPMGRGDARSFSGGGQLPPPDTGSRVQMDDLRKLSKGASGRNLNNVGALGPSMLGSRSGSGRRGLGPGMMGGRGEDSGASSRTGTPPVQKEKETTAHANAFSALAALGNEDAGEAATSNAAEESAADPEAKPSE
ncbi:eukaryotic translation initiation factor subunit eIF-4F [Pyrenophora seminiperda CCB06]|uniref:Eukaryotic translation initiation factor subunit eIF-4F n=1 Tax=Pyrenophora seminiperda CCB06 TaxID=1302712 RepID=A0A3M7MAG7_9PLEO|nr:eukaryotic translation initiation factor subunit eIF-4F [Pyrenophora seminiperda CCB06]